MQNAAPPVSLRDLISEKKLAEYLEVKPSSIQSWRRRGLPSISVGRKRFYLNTEVMTWLLAHRSSTDGEE
jgi:phage terminase Nu1 subunit (DNA packaging protein)